MLHGSNMLSVIALSAFGAILGEVVHWYHLRARLDEPAYHGMLRSPAYWTITGSMVICSAVGTSVMFGSDRLSPAQIVYVGLTFPLLLKKAVGAAKEGQVEFGHASGWRYLA